MLLTTYLIASAVSGALAIKYDPKARLDDRKKEAFSLREFEELYEDWDSVKMHERTRFFGIASEDLFKNKTESKHIVDRLSGKVSLSKVKIYGFENKTWEYWSAPNGPAPCDECRYSNNGNYTAVRYYGGFSSRLRSLEAKLNIKVDGEEKECDIVGLTLSRNSVAHQTVRNVERVDKDLNMFRLVFDFAFIWSPPIGIEIKEWTFYDDWSANHSASRHYLETFGDNDTWSPYRTHYHSPLLHYYVDPHCLNLSRSDTKYFNRVTSKYLDYEVSYLVASVMKEHFLVHAGRPFALFKLEQSGAPLTEWTLDMIASQQDWVDDNILGREYADQVNDANVWLHKAGVSVGQWASQAASDAAEGFRKFDMIAPLFG